MRAEARPFIKLNLEFEHMKHAMIQHLGAGGSEFGKAIEREVDKVVQNYDYKKAITESANDAITSIIKDYFIFGDGRKLIDSVIQSALDDVLTKLKKGFE